MIAWDKKPFPGTPLRRDVIGMKLKLIASGLDGTVSNHSQCVSALKSPPLLELITFIPCNLILPTINHKLMYMSIYIYIGEVQVQWCKIKFFDTSHSFLILIFVIY